MKAQARENRGQIKLQESDFVRSALAYLYKDLPLFGILSHSILGSQWMMCHFGSFYIGPGMKTSNYQ